MKLPGSMIFWAIPSDYGDQRIRKESPLSILLGHQQQGKDKNLLGQWGIGSCDQKQTKKATKLIWNSSNPSNQHNRIFMTNELFNLKTLQIQRSEGLHFFVGTAGF